MLYIIDISARVEEDAYVIPFFRIGKYRHIFCKIPFMREPWGENPATAFVFLAMHGAL